MTTHPLETADPPVGAEAWAIQLREQLVQHGHDRQRVDELIRATAARFRSARVRDFIPLLVERAVRRALNRDGGTSTRRHEVPADGG
jgi:hypothetical protein